MASAPFRATGLDGSRLVIFAAVFFGAAGGGAGLDGTCLLGAPEVEGELVGRGARGSCSSALRLMPDEVAVKPGSRFTVGVLFFAEVTGGAGGCETGDLEGALPPSEERTESRN